MKTVVFSKTCFISFILFYLLSTKTAGQSISGIINSYKKITAVSMGTNTVTVSDISGLTPGARVLIIQMKGATIDETNTATFGNLTSINNAGNYEFNEICGIAANDVTFKYQLTKSYTASGSVQLITVPQYSTVTVTDTLRASPWNAAAGTGGVIVLEAQTLNLNSGITVSGQGFAGAPLVDFPKPTFDCTILTPVTQYFLPASGSGVNVSGAAKGEGIADYITNKEYARGKQANGGGGGNNHNAGGGGGSNYGSGGNGGTRTTNFPNCTGPNPGVGGLSLFASGYSVANNRIFMGGGGGSGHQNNGVGIGGGNGGGIVIITADVIVAAGTSIQADGIMPSNPSPLLADPFTSSGDGAGGGGAGGAVILNVNSVTGSLLVSAKGGNGANSGQTPLATLNDCPGPGGGGGGGALWMKGISNIPNVSFNLNGGINGTISNLNPTVSCRNSAQFSTPGTGAAPINNYVLPFSTPMVCVPLPIPELKSFTGRIEQEGNIVKWIMNRIDNIASYEIERSVDQVNYTVIARIANNGNFTSSYTDGSSPAGTAYYRLKVTRTNGSVAYSPIITLYKNISTMLQWLELRPNPASQQVKVTILAQKNMPGKITIYNATGQKVYSQSWRLNKGYTTLTIPVIELQSGIHRMMIEADGVREGKTFIKN